MGDYLRYALFDKYFKQIGNCTTPLLRRRHRPQLRALPAGLVLRLGRRASPAAAGPGASATAHAHFGYQNPLAAWALSTSTGADPEVSDRQERLDDAA